jgi:hypothetical protein
MSRRSHRETLAHHEAGHAVLAVVLGCKVKTATIIPTAEYEGRVVRSNPLRGLKSELQRQGSRTRSAKRGGIALTPQWRSRVEQAISITLAGPLAEYRFNPRSRDGCFDDYFPIAALAYSVCGSAKSARAFLDKQEIATQHLVNRHWRRIERVAALLLERGKLSGDDLSKVVRGRKARAAKSRAS